MTQPVSRPVAGSVLVAASAIGASYLGVRSQRAAALDGAAGRVLHRSLGAAPDRLLGAVTDLGSVYGLGGVTAALAVSGHRRRAADVFVAGSLAWIAAQGAKPLLRRDRPYLDATGATRLVAVPAGSSWPSGHAAVVAAIAGALGPLPTAARIGTAGVVAGVGASRVYVGVHHLTDVVAGFGVGVLSAVAGRALVGAATRWPPTAGTAHRLVGRAEALG